MDGAWQFYGREAELGSLLKRLRSDEWLFGSISGRRRVGKTALVEQARRSLKQDDPSGRRTLLFQLPNSTPRDAVGVFKSAVAGSDMESAITRPARVLNLPELAIAIGDLIQAGVIVVIDGFQVCHRGPLRGLPSMLQRQVERLKGTANGGLIVIGSGPSEMEASLADRRAPLLGSLTFSLNLGPWDLRTVLEVCDQHAEGDLERCLTLWTLFGGEPKYWRLFSGAAELRSIPDWGNWAATLCESLFFDADARARDEGEISLGRELSRSNLSVLRVIAKTATCTRAGIDEALPGQTDISRVLACLVRDLRLVTRQAPAFAREGSTKARYSISNQFVSAWLSAVLPALQVARLRGRKAAVTRSMLPRLQALEGFAFERMVREAIGEVSRAGVDDFPLTEHVRGYWNRSRKGSPPIEIDVVAWNDERKRIRFGSCKRQALKHTQGSLDAFRTNVQRFLETREGRRFRDWSHEYAVYAPRFPVETRRRLNADGWVCQDLGDFRETLNRPAPGAERRGGAKSRQSLRPAKTDRATISGITICNANWGATSLSAIRGVLESVLGVLATPFEKVPADPIRVLPWFGDSPSVVEDQRPYGVFLTARNRYWSQYGFEFAQQVCHILTNYDNCKGHKHKWFDETLCQVASLFALYSMADSWVASPPPTVPEAAEFAPYHREYAERIERQHDPPTPADLPEWLSVEIAHLEADSADRARTMTLAAALLPEFRRDPSLWADCGALNTWDAHGDRDFTAYLDSWAARLRKLGAVPRTPQFLRRLLDSDPVGLRLAAMSVPSRDLDGAT